VPRTDCPDCGVKRINVPWARQGSRFTLLFESGVRVITRDPADYRWSSYRVNAIGIESELCTPYEIYCALGDDADRLAAYRALFAALISTMNRSVTSVKPRVAAKRWAMNASSTKWRPVPARDCGRASRGGSPSANAMTVSGERTVDSEIFTLTPNS